LKGKGGGRGRGGIASKDRTEEKKGPNAPTKESNALIETQGVGEKKKKRLQRQSKTAVRTVKPADSKIQVRFSEFANKAETDRARMCKNTQRAGTWKHGKNTGN